MSDVLFMNGRIDVDLSQLLRRHKFVLHSDRNRLFLQSSQLVRTHSLPPLRQAGGMQRHLMLHRREAAEVLPVRILHPPFQSDSSDSLNVYFR
jgi:hypothetical protein